MTHSVDYGDNGGGSFTRPASAPAPDSSDDYRVSYQEYDEAGRPHRVTDNAGVVSSREYDALGRVTTLVENDTDNDPGTDHDRTTTYTYNAAGQVVTQTAVNPSGDSQADDDQVTRYIYSDELDDKGSPLATNNLLRAIVYPDSDDDVASEALVNGSDGTYDRVELTYYADGALHTRTDQREVELTYDYDDRGRRIEEVVTAGSPPGDQQVDYSYDSRGRLELITTYSDAGTSVTSEVEREYDSMGQLEAEHQAHGGVVGASTPKVAYAYAGFADALRPDSITYPDGRVVDYDYSGVGDDINRPTGLSSNATTLVSYDRTGAGMMVRKDYPEPDVELTYLDGSDDYVGFDRFGRIVDHRWQDYNGSVDLDRIEHGYDRAGNRLYRKQTVQATGHDELYAYDDLHRLVDVERGTLNGNRDDISSLGFAQQWTLDSLGNWNGFDQDDDGDTTWDLSQSRTHSDANEIETITGGGWPDPAHDAAGNMTTLPKPLTPDESFTAEYDAWNRVVKLTDDADGGATVAEYQWDGQGRRIVAEVYDGGTLDETRHFYYRDHSMIEQRVDGTADTDMDVQHVWGLGYVDELIARHDGTDWLFALQDANYRVTAIVDDTGAVQERYRYTAYGQRTALNPDFSEHNDPDEGSFAFRIGHQGLRHDASGLVYNRARMLHVTVGRFTSRDPLGYVDGMSLYQYVRSNALTMTDSSGRYPEFPGHGSMASPASMFTLMAGISLVADQRYNSILDGLSSYHERLRAAASGFRNAYRLLGYASQIGTGGNNRFVYTCKYGWLDHGHFINNAMITYYTGTLARLASFESGYEGGRWVAWLGSFLNEVGQHAVLSDSAWTPEDLISNPQRCKLSEFYAARSGVILSSRVVN